LTGAQRVYPQGTKRFAEQCTMMKANLMSAAYSCDKVCLKRVRTEQIIIINKENWRKKERKKNLHSYFKGMENERSSNL